jgi:16S rRNA processing protein RimM
LTSPEPLGDGTGPAGDWTAIAFIQTTHGRRGELSADLLTDFPERFVAGLQVVVGDAGRQRNLRVEAARFHKGRVILKFEGVDSITAAETLRGALVQIPRSERVPLPEGRLYVSDLMGCSVVEQGAVIGTVVGWEETGAVPLLRVKGSGDELLIPFTPTICYAVDPANKQILVSTPEGLRELNLEKSPGRRIGSKSASRASRKQKR